MPDHRVRTASGIGAQVRCARISMRLRQTDLAELTGITISHLSDIERNYVTPTIPTLRKLGEALNRPLEYFLTEKRAKPRSLGMVIQGSSIGGLAVAHFANLVEAKTNGEMKLRLYQQSSLGTAREQVESLVEGAIHLYIDELHSLEPCAKLCGPVFLPYFFKDRAHYYRFLNSDIFQKEIYEKLLESGIHLLNPVSNWECGSYELLFSTVPIFTPDDLVGRRFRSYPSEAAVALRHALKAEPVIVEFAQASAAFASGQMDIFLVPAAYFSSIQIQRHAKYATLINYGYTLNLTIAINEHEYLKLSPDVQRCLEEAACEAGQYCAQVAKEKTEADLIGLSKVSSLPIIHPDEQLWRSRFDAAIRQICAGKLLPPGQYEAIQSL